MPAPKRSMTAAELAALPTAVDIPTAARALGIGRTRAYELARTGRFPVKVLRLGAGFRVVTADLRAALSKSDETGADATGPEAA